MGNSVSNIESEEQEESSCLSDILSIMGNTVTGGSSSSSHKSSKRNVEKKVEQASKTGVLNLVGMVSFVLTNNLLTYSNHFI